MRGSGIYQIINNMNGKKYVGSAQNLRVRQRRHINDLKSGEHRNRHIQRAWDKYGESVFSFHVLEYVGNHDFLIEREQYYMDILKPEYNISPTAGSCRGLMHIPGVAEKLRQNLIENAVPASKVWHGSDDGKLWHAEHYQRMKHKLHKPKRFECKYCREPFEATNTGANQFCGNKCKSAWRRKEGMDNEFRVCPQCGEKYSVNKYSKQECCSRACSNKLKPRLPQLCTVNI